MKIHAYTTISLHFCVKWRWRGVCALRAFWRVCVCVWLMTRCQSLHFSWPSRSWSLSVSQCQAMRIAPAHPPQWWVIWVRFPFARCALVGCCGCLYVWLRYVYLILVDFTLLLFIFTFWLRFYVYFTFILRSYAHVYLPLFLFYAFILRSHYTVTFTFLPFYVHTFCPFSPRFYFLPFCWFFPLPPCLTFCARAHRVRTRSLRSVWFARYVVLFTFTFAFVHVRCPFAPTFLAFGLLPGSFVDSLLTVILRSFTSHRVALRWAWCLCLAVSLPFTRTRTPRTHTRCGGWMDTALFLRTQAICTHIVLCGQEILNRWILHFILLALPAAYICLSISMRGSGLVVVTVCVLILLWDTHTLIVLEKILHPLHFLPLGWGHPNNPNPHPTISSHLSFTFVSLSFVFAVLVNLYFFTFPWFLYVLYYCHAHTHIHCVLCCLPTSFTFAFTCVCIPMYCILCACAFACLLGSAQTDQPQPGPVTAALKTLAPALTFGEVCAGDWCSVGDRSRRSSVSRCLPGL